MEIRYKQPADVIDYDIHMEEWFRSMGNDQLDEVVFAGVFPDGELTLGTDEYPAVSLIGEVPKIAKVWVRGGVSGREYKITVRLKTRIGRVEEIDFIIIVEDL